MSLTITAVSAAGPADIPARVPVPQMELPVSDFVAILQDTPMSGMPQLANPAALASEIFNHLRGFVERAHYYDNLKIPPARAADDGNVTLASAEGGRLAELLGGPAQDNSALADLAPTGEGGSSPSSPVAGNSIADLQRLQEFCLAMMNFSLETSLVGDGVTEGLHSVNTLLRAQ